MSGLIPEGAGRGGARIEIDLDAVETNARTIVSMCTRHGVMVAGVTKSCCGMPEIAERMLRGGVRGIAESRLENIRRLRRAGIESEYYLLRSPHPGQALEMISLADVSLNSEIETLRSLSGAAGQLGVVHRVILMVDLGDLREGESPGAILDLVRAARALEGIQIMGLGTNLACLMGVVPDCRNMNELARLSEQASELLGRRLPIISGGNSSALRLIKNGTWFEGINHLRIGESIMLGWDITDKSPLAGTRNDAFTIWAPIIELKAKPSRPRGRLGPNAFNEFFNETRGPADEGAREGRGQGTGQGARGTALEGTRLRALVALGKQDVGAGHLRPILEGLRVVGSTSDHTVVDATECMERLRIGDEIGFLPDYGSLVGAMTSPYVDKVPVKGTH